MNLVTLIGRLTADPELKFFSSGTAISKGTIAIDRSYKKDNQTVTDLSLSKFGANKPNTSQLVSKKATLLQ